MLFLLWGREIAHPVLDLLLILRTSPSSSDARDASGAVTFDSGIRHGVVNLLLVDLVHVKLNPLEVKVEVCF